MNVFQNSTMKKYIITNIAAMIALMSLTFYVTSMSIGSIQEEVMTNNYAIVGSLANNNPGMEKEIVEYITQRDKLEYISKGEEILSRYGYGEDATSFNEPIISGSYNNMLITNMGIIVLVFFILLWISLVFFNKIYIEIEKVNKFIEDVLERRKVSNILDNEEGQLGILKNELLRMTNALKENVELLKGEKVFLNNVISDISHQLRTPMTSLMVLNDLLHNEDLPKDKKDEFLLRIRTQLERMEWLVKSMLKLAKVEAGVIDFKKKKEKLSDLINRAIEPMRVPMDIKSQSLIIKGNESDSFIGDIEWSVEALVNIIKNCIEHTNEHGKITIEYEENSLMSKIVVTDTGEGIADKDLPHIFERFYRGKSSNKADSVGIGLAMAKSIVESQNGVISVESKVGVGTSFYISFYKGVI